MCGKRFGDGGAEHPGLDEVAKFFKNVVAGCVVGNDDGVPGDAAVSAPTVPAGGGDGPAVADRGNDEVVQRGAVDKAALSGSGTGWIEACSLRKAASCSMASADWGSPAEMNTGTITS